MSKRVLAVIAAILVGVLGTTAVVLYARAADRRALAGQEAVEAFVVRKPIPAGTTADKAVQEGWMRQELLARKAVPDDVLTKVDESNGQLVANATLQPGSLVLRASFTARAASAGGLAIPAGKVAVSIDLADPAHVGPFVTVGSHVAVYDTFNLRPSTDPLDVLEKLGKQLDQLGQKKATPKKPKATSKNKPKKKPTSPAGDHLMDRHEYTRATRVLLADVEVLAVGASAEVLTAQQADKAAAAQDDPVRRTLLVTLAVTPEQAERLVHVAHTGTLTLALLGPETTVKPGLGTDDLRLFEESK
jgi:pilus assembly protein CpaB